MKFLVKTCPGRENYVDYLKRHMPDGTVFVMDDQGCAMANFKKALLLADYGPAVHMEDDVILTRDFEKKIMAVIAAHSEDPIQFFSMRKKDLTVGSRWEPGRSYLMNQCHYLPAGMSEDVYWFHETLPDEWKAKHPNGTDQLVQDYLAHHKRKYWLHVPSLVDHRVGKSAIDPRRASTNRQSFTFTDPLEN